ncbi:MAG: hypothetical protein AB8B51_11395 [Sedimentitalea sp.]
MFGVVLWSDTEVQKAVIWCEDHGDLAFYNHSADQGDAVAELDPGDWVQFEVTLDRHMRLATNPRLVSEALCPDIARTLDAVRQQDCGPAPMRRGSARIIPFGRPRTQERVRVEAMMAQTRA